MNDNPIPKVGAWTTTGDSPPGVGASGEERGGMVKFGCPYRCPSFRFWCPYCGLSEAGKVLHKEQISSCVLGIVLGTISTETKMG